MLVYICAAEMATTILFLQGRRPMQRTSVDLGESDRLHDLLSIGTQGLRDSIGFLDIGLNMFQQYHGILASSG